MTSLFSLPTSLGVTALSNKCSLVGELSLGSSLGKLGGAKVVDVSAENVFWSRLKDPTDSLVPGLDDLHISRTRRRALTGFAAASMLKTFLH